MQTHATRRPARAATPARWQAALERAIAGGVQVRQLNTSGAWIATSSSDGASAYEIGVVGGVARSCTCAAGEYGDPVCCHRAAYYRHVGLLDLIEGPCEACGGTGYVRKTSALFGTSYRVDCRSCGGRGNRPPTIIAPTPTPVPAAA